MNNLRTTPLLSLLATVASALTLTGCLSVSTPTIDMSPIVTTGAPFCESSSDGKMVACGAIAPVCLKSPDGHAVACGGMAPFCETSSDGRTVACGGKATHCAKSTDGRMVACGGAAPFCEKSSDGRMVACGGINSTTSQRAPTQPI